MNSKSTNAKRIRGAAGLPDSSGKPCGVVDMDWERENTFLFDTEKRSSQIEHGFCNRTCKNGTFFDYGPSGGSASPNTEVNADAQSAKGLQEKCISPANKPKEPKT